MPLVRVLSLLLAAAVLGAGAAYAIAGLVKPDEPQAVAPVVIDPAAGTARTAAATTPATTRTTRTQRTTTSGDDHGGWEAGPPIESGDDSGGQGRGRGRGRGGDDSSGSSGSSGSGGSGGSGGGDDSSGRGRGGDD